MIHSYVKESIKFLSMDTVRKVVLGFGHMPPSLVKTRIQKQNLAKYHKSSVGFVQAISQVIDALHKVPQD